MICLVLYFVTSSDSGSLVIDIIGANGIQDPPTLQRIFWALSEGATASVLLNFGGNDALRALQTVAIVGGLPYTFVLFLMCQALYYVCQEEMNDLDIDRKSYARSVLFERPVYARSTTGSPPPPPPTTHHPIAFPTSFIFQLDHNNNKDYSGGAIRILEAMFMPFLPFGRICAKLWGVDFKGQWTAIGAVPFFTIILFVSLMGIERQMKMLGGALYILYITLIAVARYSGREKIGVKRGDLITDWMLSLLLYFLVLPQLECEIAAADAKGEFNQVPILEVEAEEVDERGIALQKVDSAI